MNGEFHPGVRGILCAALAQHEQTLAMLRLAAVTNSANAPIDAETEARYTGIITGLKRMLIVTEPDLYGETSLDSVQETLSALGLATRLVRTLADFSLAEWSFGRDGVQAMLRKGRDGDARAAIRQIADRLELEYDCTLHGSSGISDYVTASGEIDGVPVKLWVLTTTLQPHCETHYQLLVDGACQACAEGTRHAALPDETETPRCGAVGTVALFADSVTCAECAAMLAEQLDAAEPAAVAEYDPGDPDYEVGTEAGNCSGCDGWHRPPWCADLSEPDPDGSADSTPTEPPGDAL